MYLNFSFPVHVCNQFPSCLKSYQRYCEQILVVSLIGFIRETLRESGSGVFFRVWDSDPVKLEGRIRIRVESIQIRNYGLRIRNQQV